MYLSLSLSGRISKYIYFTFISISPSFRSRDGEIEREGERWRETERDRERTREKEGEREMERDGEKRRERGR